MYTKEELERSTEFIRKLRNAELKTPNDFTIEMGKLIKTAREGLGLTQNELAKKINRRPETLSLIENGKSEIGVLTLSLLALELNKPVTYFFPTSLFTDVILDIRTPYELKMLEYAQTLEEYGAANISLSILKAIIENCEFEEKIASGEIFPSEFEQQ
jgi:transcriptional regulator with XRE-family HTH domain